MIGKKTLGYLLIILIPSLIVIANFNALVTNKSYYQSLYIKVGVYQNFDSQVAIYATDNLFGYFRGQNKLDQNFFSMQAVSHLKDVKDLISFSNGLLVLSLIGVSVISASLILKKQFKIFLKSLFISSIITAVLITALGLGAAVTFDSFFLKFHQILFTNTLWLFPADDNLIRLFPEQFFVEFANHLAFNIFISSVVIAVISFVLNKRARPKY